MNIIVYGLRKNHRSVSYTHLSSSLPLVSKTLVVKGHKLLDGGIADSIPIRKSIEDGNEKNVVILTRDKGYRKEPNKLMPLMHLRYPKYKAFLHAMETRHIRYNETLDFLEEQELSLIHI